MPFVVSSIKRNGIREIGEIKYMTMENRGGRRRLRGRNRLTRPGGGFAAAGLVLHLGA